MPEKKRKRLLLINMEYSQNEVNEPINVDILLALFPKNLFDHGNTSIIYRDLSEDQHDAIKNSDIILISSKISSYMELQRILDNCTGKLVIIGGILAIGAPAELAAAFPDAVINTGEAETNIALLLRLAYQAESVEEFKKLIFDNHVNNVCFYLRETSKIYSSERVVCELISHPFLEHNRVSDIVECGGLVRMETSRGCPWNQCNFCIMPWKFCGKTWRPYSDSKIKAEIEHLIRNGVDQIWFTDEDFIGNYGHLSKLCSIVEHCNVSCKKNIRYGGSTSAFTLLNLGNNLDNLLERMFSAGIKLIFIGIESGSVSQLKRYNKGVTVEENRQILAKLRQFKFEVDVGFIMFDADTTVSELEENLNFIQQNGLRGSISRFAKKLRLTPHTAFYDDYLQRGLITSAFNPNELYYEYRFCDPTIELIASYVEKLDQRILLESYHLQALIRSGWTQIETEYARNRLHELREVCYLFLRMCVDFCKQKNKLSASDIQVLYDYCLNPGDDRYVYD